MDLKKRTQLAVQSANEIVGTQLSQGQRDALTKVFEDIVIDALRESAASCSKAAQHCCQHDLDMAHKVALEVKQANSALVANLSSLR
jgi:hypothetical protein